VTGVSPEALAAFDANHAMRQCLVFLNDPAMQQPEACIGGAVNLLGAEEKLKADSALDFLKKFPEGFAY